MTPRDTFRVWKRILSGYRPFLALEITKSCPLNCPGCYAFLPQHLNGGAGLQSLAEYRGQELVHGVLELVSRLRPLHISLVGGEPLLRRSEIGLLLPEFHRLGIEVQLVTSAVIPIPKEYGAWSNLHVVVSVDGLPAEHDRRRFPATYERILNNIAGQTVVVHCTVTRQMLRIAGQLGEFARFWSKRDEARRIWFSLYTPQALEDSPERLRSEDRKAALEELAELRRVYPKVYLTDLILDGLRHPPRGPNECVFSQVTACVSADLRSEIVPCQLGGRPECSECGCLASVGLAGVGRFRIAGLIPAAKVLAASSALGRLSAHRREFCPTSAIDEHAGSKLNRR